MTKLDFFLILISLELIALFLMLFVLVFERIFLSLFRKKAIYHIDYLHRLFIQSLKEKKIRTTGIPKKFTKPFPLIISIKDFNYLVKGEPWDSIKITLITNLLFRYAEKWTYSFFWKKRLFASMTFSMHHLHNHKKCIARLLRDPSFYIQCYAMQALIKENSAEALKYAISAIAKASVYQKLYIEDLISQCSGLSLLPAVAILKKSKDQLVQSTCLNILSSQKTLVKSQLVYSLANSPNLLVREAAVAFHANNPQKNSQSVLLKALNDENSDIKKEACRGLRSFPSRTSARSVSALLDDKDWYVRVEAAQSLKKMNKEGVIFLKNAKKSKDKLKQQLASYVLGNCI